MTETATKKENAFDRKRTFRQAFLDSLPVMAGYVVLGLGYGLIMETSGYSFLWAMAMLPYPCSREEHLLSLRAL